MVGEQVAAAGEVAAFDDEHAAARLREGLRRHAAAGARADHDRVVLLGDRLRGGEGGVLEQQRLLAVPAGRGPGVDMWREVGAGVLRREATGIEQIAHEGAGVGRSGQDPLSPPDPLCLRTSQGDEHVPEDGGAGQRRIQGVGEERAQLLVAAIGRHGNSGALGKGVQLIRQLTVVSEACSVPPTRVTPTPTGRRTPPAGRDPGHRA